MVMGHGVANDGNMVKSDLKILSWVNEFNSY